jgi:hypothetical protein
MKVQAGADRGTGIRTEDEDEDENEDDGAGIGIKNASPEDLLRGATFGRLWV